MPVKWKDLTILTEILGTILHKLILENKDETDLQFIVQLLELSEKVFKTALSKKHKISHRLIFLIKQAVPC